MYGWAKGGRGRMGYTRSSNIRECQQNKNHKGEQSTWTRERTTTLEKGEILENKRQKSKRLHYMSTPNSRAERKRI
jgi:hypothetical protein